MIMTLIWITIGFILGFISKSIKWKKKPIKEKYLRRGIHKTTYQVTYNSSKPSTTVDVVFELGEVECADDISKVEVISVKTNLSEYNNSESEQNRLISMINNSWMSSSEIKWITTVGEKRNQKIDEILN